ncbi:molecular chaperone DnaJ [Marinobacter sp. NP-4(2019)]|uniref:molecular chaperone DnaJ n=1 Tax=Marinobacter sp. NP-4(2019) TaxID=2488665 RepID=UPI000FC3F2B8|nr:molecular chaperone DnaJ [Marinobacter sp. NP-4(2019)]AZT85291.1 molecular chaperone DnaJ [Marinobacter sp. NP-4(2019)]
MHWILGIALTAAVFVILKQWGALSAERKKAAAWKILLVVGGAVLLFMVLTGRIHVLTATIAALVPLLRKLPSLLKFAPMVSRVYRQQRQSGNDEAGAGGARSGGAGQRTGSGPMSVREACDILGVALGCSEDEVVMAHRRLMQKIHPDRGGNDYLAAKVNEAKAVLLASRKGAA